jgi:hypothetical protein
MGYDRRDWDERQLKALENEIAERLRVVCEGVPPEEFAALVERIARIQRKYEQRRADDVFPNLRDGGRSDLSG